MKYNPISRRLFLRGAGGSCLSLPLLTSLLPKEARAQASASPKRFIGIKTWNVAPVRRWHPATSGIASNYNVRPFNNGNATQDGTTELTQQIAEPTGTANGTYFAHEAPLSDFMGDTTRGPGLSEILGPELNPFREKMLLLRGLTFPANCNHNNGGWLGNFAASEAQGLGARENATLDQILAYSNVFYPSVPSGPRSLSMAPGRFAPISFSDNGNRSARPEGISPIQNPRDAWDDVFSGFDPATPGAPTGDDSRLRLVNRVIEDYRSVRDGSRISYEDRQQLERHVSFLNDVQARLEDLNQNVAACVRPDRPTASYSNSPEGLREMYEAYIDVIAASIMCDQTRVFTLNCFKTVSQRGGELVMGQGCSSCNSGFGVDGGNPADWHNAAHSYAGALSANNIGADERQLITGYNWIAANVYARLLERLDIPEQGGSTYLDNSVVMWGNELGANHFPDSVPTLLAGGLGGYLDTGKYCDYVRRDGGSPFSQENGIITDAAHYNRLLIALLQGFGLSPSEYETERGTGNFGETRFLQRNGPHWNGFDPNRVNQPLNGIVKS